jgi:hypothetical protein
MANAKTGGNAQPNSAQNINWTAITQAISSGIIPAPISSDENGMPIWDISGKRITWQQVQQYVWERLQAQDKATGGALEAGLMMPAVPEMPGFNFEQFAEQKVETAAERQKETANPERAGQPVVPNKNATAAQPAPQKPRIPKMIGRSAPLQSVDPTDPTSMLTFVDSHKNDIPGKSSRFLAEFLDRILKIVTVDAA